MKPVPHIKLAANPLRRLSNWVQRHVVEQILLRWPYQRMYRIVAGHIFFQTLSAAVELNLFSLIDSHKRLTREQIATALNCAEQPIRILLLGCTALGLLKKRGSHYSNTLLTSQLLLPTADKTIVDVVRWQHHVNYKGMFHFAEAIRANSNVGLQEFSGTGSTLYQRLTHEPRLEQIFQDAMENISAQANQMLVSNLDLRNVNYLLDVGGGNGANIVALAQVFPQLRAAVLDSPSVCEIARQNIAAQGLNDRLTACSGDCFTDPFPEGIDVILFAHFFTIWSEQRSRQLLRKCFATLPKGGAVVIFNMMQRDTEDGPLAAAMGSPYFLTLATGEGMLYTWREYQQWLREAGFRDVKSRALPRDHGVIIATKV